MKKELERIENMEEAKAFWNKLKPEYYEVAAAFEIFYCVARDREETIHAEATLNVEFDEMADCPHYDMPIVLTFHFLVNEIFRFLSDKKDKQLLQYLANMKIKVAEDAQNIRMNFEQIAQIVSEMPFLDNETDRTAAFCAACLSHFVSVAKDVLSDELTFQNIFWNKLNNL